MVLLGKVNSHDAVPLFWKSKTIPQVCHSAKDAETRNVMKLVDDSKYLADRLEELLFGETPSNKIPVKLYTDSKPTLESIASTKQVERKLLRNCVSDLKTKLEDNSVQSYSWLESKHMVADLLTKECVNSEDILDILHENIFRHALNEDNLVSYANGEIRMTNNKIKDVSSSQS